MLFAYPLRITTPSGALLLRLRPVRPDLSARSVAEVPCYARAGVMTTKGDHLCRLFRRDGGIIGLLRGVGCDELGDELFHVGSFCVGGGIKLL